MDASFLTPLKKRLLRLPLGPALRAQAARFGAPRPDANPPLFGPPYVVAGALSLPTGLGEAARLGVAALEALGLPVHAVDVQRPERPPPGPGTLVLYANAPETPAVLRAVGAAQLAGKRVVGFWHWELPRVPPVWRAYAADVHEIFVPSRFVASAVAARIDTPLRIVPHPVRLPDIAPLGRGAFGLRDDEFVALTVFNLDSGFHRKNPVGAIRAFVEPFGARPGHRLVIKTREIPGYAREKAALREACADSPNVLWLDRTLSAGELMALMRATDVLLSLHRSEGFGLVPSQALRLGRPVVATDWSSTTDFLTPANAALVGYDLVPVRDPYGVYVQSAEVWAEPHVSEAASWLSRLAQDAPLRLRLGAQARLDAERLFSVEAFGRAWAR